MIWCRSNRRRETAILRGSSLKVFRFGWMTLPSVEAPFSSNRNFPTVCWPNLSVHLISISEAFRRTVWWSSRLLAQKFRCNISISSTYLTDIVSLSSSSPAWKSLKACRFWPSAQNFRPLIVSSVSVRPSFDFAFWMELLGFASRNLYLYPYPFSRIYLPKGKLKKSQITKKRFQNKFVQISSCPAH